MKNPKKRETKNRDEMMCPRCQREGLEKHPGYADEYEGIYEIIKATRCPNEDCPFHKEVPEEKVKMQMPDRNISDVIKRTIDIDTGARDIATYIIVLFVVVLMFWTLGIGPFGSETSNSQSDGSVVGPTTDTSISGQVEPLNGDFPQVQLYQDGRLIDQTMPNEKGEYTIDAGNIQQGEYMLYTNYEGINYNPPGELINITQNSPKNITKDIKQNPRPLNVNIDQSASRSEFSINYSNPNNIQPVDLRINNIMGDEVERERRLSTVREDQNVILPVFPTAQQYRVNADITEESFSDTKTYTGKPESFQIFGNAPAEDIKIELTNESAADKITRSFNVPSTGTTETISVASEQTLGPVEVTIKNGGSEQPRQATGEWNGQDNVTITTGNKDFTQATLQLIPKTIENSNRIESSITGTEIGHQFAGNSPITDAKIEFTGGGDVQSSLEESENISVDAQDRTMKVVKKLIEANSDGIYTMEIKPVVERNDDLVSTFYRINGDKTFVSENDSIRLSLSDGDVVEVGIKAELDTEVSNQEPPNFASDLNPNLDIVDFSFSNSNPNPGEVVDFEITVENTGSSQVTDTIQVYRNNNLFNDKTVSISPGEQKTLGIRDFGSTSVSENKGTEVWFVNNFGPYLLPVGVENPEFGKGSLQANLFDIGSEGEVKVDTDKDGEFDCKVKATGGICRIDEISSGFNSIPIEEIGVSGTNYVLEYTSKKKPSDVKVDVGENGITEFSQNVLQNTESTSVQLPPEEVKIDIETSNNVPLTYGLSWDSDSVVNQPVVIVDDKTVISNTGKFIDDKTFEIGELSQGDHVLRFRSQSGGYDAEVSWSEDKEQAFPRAIINNQVACKSSDFADNTTCYVGDEIDTRQGINSIRFDKTSKQIFDFRVSHTARAVADNIEISVDGQTSEIFSRPTVEADSWEQISNTNDFTRGDNSVSIDVEEQNNIVPDVEVSLVYLLETKTVEQLKLEVINGNGNNTKNLNIAESNDQILTNTNITIDKQDLSLGENIIRFKPTPIDGIFSLKGDIVINQQENIEFRTLD